MSIDGPDCLHRQGTVGGNVKSVVAFWNKRQKVGYVKDHNGFFGALVS